MYLYGIYQMMVICTAVITNEKRKQHVRQRITDFMERAEALKNIIAEEKKQAEAERERLQAEAAEAAEGEIFAKSIENSSLVIRTLSG